VKTSLLAVAFSVLLITTATTTISNINTAAAQQVTPLTYTLNGKPPGVAVPEKGQYVQVGIWDIAKDVYSAAKSVIKSNAGSIIKGAVSGGGSSGGSLTSAVKGVISGGSLSGSSLTSILKGAAGGSLASAVATAGGSAAVQGTVQDANQIARNAIQETKSLCTTVNIANIPALRNVCTTVNKVQGVAQQGINQLPGFTQQGQTQTDTVETGREPVLLPSAQPPTPQAAVASPTSNQQRLQVSFTSIKINNDHDPNIVGQNDGEWKIGVLVNGQFRDLSPPGSPLGDARGGSTYSLSNIQPVVLNVDKSRGALVISTIGQEIDGCNFNFKIPSSLITAGLVASAIYTGGASAALSAASTGSSYQGAIKVAQGVINKFCGIVNKNDAIGTISDTYGPSTTFGAGPHSTTSTPYSDSGRDFVLTYQIKPVQQFQQPFNPIVRDHRTTPSSSLPTTP
jgi:hypothetical protein